MHRPVHPGLSLETTASSPCTVQYVLGFPRKPPLPQHAPSNTFWASQGNHHFLSMHRPIRSGLPKETTTSSACTVQYVLGFPKKPPPLQHAPSSTSWASLGNHSFLSMHRPARPGLSKETTTSSACIVQYVLGFPRKPPLPQHAPSNTFWASPKKHHFFSMHRPVHPGLP